MSEELKSALTDPQSAMSRIVVLEQKVALLERAMTTVHGARWMDELKDRDEPRSGE
jgi:hypothetical protein